MQRGALAAVLLLGLPALVLGQATAAATPTPPTTTWGVRNWTRVEWWRFFEPPAGGGDNEYAYPANRLHVGLRRDAPRYAFTAAFQYVQFVGLPSGAVGPGPLGLGAVYFAHAGRSDSRQLYLRYLNLELKGLLPGVRVQVGRMPYSSGGETISPNPRIEAIKQQRVAARLLGEFEWSLYQRGYDGVRVDGSRGAWNATFAAFHPTQGGFEDAAGLMMNDVTVFGGNLTRRGGGTEVQAFGIRYNDGREVAARPDNSGRAATGVDVGVTTFGATVVSASEPRAGRQWDGLLWGAAQTGHWYEQTHRAASVAAEAGFQWGLAPWRPWLRAGVLWASGDGDASDDRHATFFAVLPTVRRYSQSATYAQMNHPDLFGQALLRPVPPLSVRVDVHRVGLASSQDRWYFGSGATQSRGTQFGFATRPSYGSTRLATVVEGGVEYALSPHWTINGYLGVLRGGAVVQRAFAGRTMTFAYLENVVQF
jgi:hypothetical protein